MNNIKKARIDAGRSQKEVAITLGVSSPTVSEWESGKKTPNAQNLIALSQYLHVTVDYLLGQSSESSCNSEDLIRGVFIYLSEHQQTQLEKLLFSVLQQSGMSEKDVVVRVGMSNNIFPRLQKHNLYTAHLLDLLLLGQYFNVRNELLAIINAKGDSISHSKDMQNTFVSIAEQVYKKTCHLNTAGQKQVLSIADALLGNQDFVEDSAPTASTDKAM